MNKYLNFYINKTISIPCKEFHHFNITKTMKLLFISCTFFFVTHYSSKAQDVSIDSMLIQIVDNIAEIEPNETEAKIETLLLKHPKRNFIQDSILADIFHELGKEYFYYNRYTKSIEITQKSLDIKYQLHPPHHLNITKSLFNIGSYYENLGRYNEALKYILKTQDIRDKHHTDKPFYIAIVYLALADIYFSQSDYKLAIHNYELARQIFKKIGDERLMISSTNGKALSLNYYGKSEEAIQLLEQTLQNITTENISIKPVVLTNLADIWSTIDKKKSLELYKKATKEYEKYNDFYSDVNYTNYHNLAYTEIELQQYKKAKKNLDIAFDICTKVYETNYNFEYSNLYDKYGDLYYFQGDYPKALKNYQLTIINNTVNFRDTSIFRNPNFEQEIIIGEKTDLLIYLPSKARAFKAWYKDTKNPKHLEAALDIYLLVDKLIDQIRFEHHEEGSKLFWREKVHPIYVKAIETAYELGDKKTAFHFSEKSKAILLMDVLRENQAKEIASLPDSISMTIKRQQNLIYEKELELSYEDNVEIRKSLLDSKQKLQKYIRKLEENHPQYYQYKYDTNITTINEIQEKLRSNQILIEYFVSDSSLYSFIIEKNNFTVQSLPIDSRFKHKIQAIRKGISDINYITEQPQAAYEDYAINAHDVFNKLFSKNIQDKLLEKKVELTIIPDRWLNFIPFEALLTEEADLSYRDYKNLPYLLRLAPIQYSYSASLSHHFTKKKETLRPYLGIAPSYKGFEDDTLTTSRSVLSLRDDLGELKANKDEVKNTNTIFQGDVWLGEQANEQNFKQYAPNYKILHLAMHAFVDDLNPLQSKMIFTPKKNQLEDNYLNIYELYSMKLNAELVVLSACSTGEGHFIQGEGVMSIARAFTYTGCPNTIMSMWKAEDSSTASIIETFFKKLNDGKTKTDALYLAKKEYLEQNAGIITHPFFWSNFVLIGDTYPNISSNLLIDYCLFLAIGLLCLLSFFIFKKHLSK